MARHPRRAKAVAASATEARNTALLVISASALAALLAVQLLPV